MKRLFLLILVLILLIPNVTEINKFELYSAEGMVAIQISATEDGEPTPIPEPEKPVTPTKYKCNTCKDTKVIKPDGVVEIPCPDCQVPKNSVCQCGCQKEGCSCQKSSQKSKEKEVQQIGRRIILFTQPDRCPPCKDYEKLVEPELIKLGIKIGSGLTDDIQKIDPTRPKEDLTWAKYKHLSTEAVPLFLAFEGDKLVDHSVGKISKERTLQLLGR